MKTSKEDESRYYKAVQKCMFCKHKDEHMGELVYRCGSCANNPKNFLEDNYTPIKVEEDIRDKEILHEILDLDAILGK